MFFWTPYVFVRTVACFIAGILVGIYQPNLIPERLAVWLLVCLVLLFLVSALRGQRTIYTGPAAMLVLMISGYLHTLYRTDSRHPDHIIHYQGSITGYKVVVSGYPEEKVRSWKVEAAVQALHDGEAWKPCTGKMLLYLSRQDFSSPFHYGDVLLIRGAPNLLREPQNPGEFDYRRFLTFRKIYHQHFLRGGHVQHLSHEPPFRLMEYAMIARAWADKEVRKHVHGKNERAVASALLLGVRDGLDNELVHAYASSGAMHVLAVSGLHVGIIYLILNFLLKPLKSRRYGKWLIAILSVGTLWCYAFITGLSASVLRAVTMFSFMAFARPLSYSTNIFNTLAVAAFCLLMWEPYLIMSVGFQLSFMAGRQNLADYVCIHFSAGCNICARCSLLSPVSGLLPGVQSVCYPGCPVVA
jgi:competence protein ComEC